MQTYIERKHSLASVQISFFKQFTFKSMNVNTHLEIQFHSGEKPVSCKEYRLALLMSSNFIKKKKAMKIQ